MPWSPALQLDLFADVTLRYAAARRALSAGAFARARGELRAVGARYPDDAEVAAALAALRAVGAPCGVEELRAALRRLHRSGAPDDGLPARVLDAVRIALARAVEAAMGPGAVLDGQPAGALYLAAGLPAEAAVSLQATLARSGPDARLLVALAEARARAGDAPAARRAWRDAFRVDPAAVDVEAIADEAVRALETAARVDYELGGELGDPRAWVPAVGVVERVFPIEPGERAGLPFPAWERGVAALPPPQAFYEGLALFAGGLLLHADRDAVRLAARRRLRPLAPALFRVALHAGRLG